VSALMCRDAGVVFNKLLPLFPALPFLPSIIVQDSLDGLEGTFSFAVNALDSSAYGEWGSSVIAHEALHFWVGVYTGDYDDPWWKEGTAEYLGLQVSSELNISKKSYARSILVLDLSSNPAVMGLPLAGGDAVRDYIYYQSHTPDSVKNAAFLVYTKGAQVCMILDQIIRERTNGNENLLKATAALCNHHNHGAFTRAEFKAELENGIGSLDTFFERYVDSPGAIDTTMLASTFARLDSSGAFGSVTGIAKRAGWVDK
jgi:hypothetical protein